MVTAKLLDINGHWLVALKAKGILGGFIKVAVAGTAV